MEPDDLLCSCNAWSRKTPVEHAQSETSCAPCLGERGREGKAPRSYDYYGEKETTVLD